MSYDVWMTIDTGGPDPAEVYSAGNMTSNVAPMWRHAGADVAEMHGKTGAECIPILEAGLSHMRHPDNAATYRAMNPSNGWGSHDGACEFIERILAGCRAHPRATVHVSR